MIQNKPIQRVEQILVVVGTLVVIYINYLAGTGQINNTTPGDISDKYSNLLTPAGYAFTIWSIIYLGLICFSIYQALPTQATNPHFTKIRKLYIISCLANIGWIFSWHYDQILISLGLMLVILVTMLLINRTFYFNDNRGSFGESLFTRIPFGIYFGWITAATILNATIALIYVGIKFERSVTVILACLLIAIATTLAILVRRGFENAIYPLAIAWALLAIAVKQQSETAIFVTGIIGAIISVLSIFLKKKKLY